MKKVDTIQKHLSWYIAVGISFSVLVGLVSCKRAQMQEPRVTRASPKTKRSLGGFSRVDGTPYLWAAIGSESGRSDYSFFESGKSSYGGNVYNYVFFDTVSESTDRLLPTNDCLIIGTTRYPELKDGDTAGLPVQWFLYSLVKRDSNGDKEFTYEDKKTIALSDFNGKNYVEVISDVESIFGQSMRGSNSLIVFYNKDAKRYFSVIDLLNKKLLTTKEMPSLGDDVQ
jgi:hypothetical protein